MGGGWGRERQKKSTVISPWGSQGEKKKSNKIQAKQLAQRRADGVVCYTFRGA